MLRELDEVLAELVRQLPVAEAVPRVLVERRRDLAQPLVVQAEPWQELVLQVRRIGQLLDRRRSDRLDV